MRLFNLSFLLGVVSLSAFAAPITYTINFSGGTPTPSGSFSYDSDTQTFADFLITWDTLVFDFTATANGLYAINGACDGAGTPAAADLFAALSGSPSCGSPEWSSFRNGGSPVHDEFTLFSSLQSVDNFHISGHITPPASRSARAQGSGTFSLSSTSEVPEPSSLLLMSAGGVLLAFRRRRAPGNRSSQAGR